MRCFRTILISLILSFFLYPSILLSAEFSGKVLRVLDGDSLSVMHDGKAEEVRLFGIDCPEFGQAYGMKAEKVTSKTAFGATVTVTVKDLDKYGRTVGDVGLADGRDLSQELVKAGLAWWYRYYAPDDKALEKLEEEARNSGTGLWADQDPTPPWNFRKAKKKVRN